MFRRNKANAFEMGVPMYRVKNRCQWKRLSPETGHQRSESLVDVEAIIGTSQNIFQGSQGADI